MLAKKMSVIARLLKELESKRECILHGPVGAPTMLDGQMLPDDLLEFYRICGGFELSKDSNYPLTLSSPSKLTASNMTIIGEDIQDDQTAFWRIIAIGRTDEYISIDVSAEKTGRCYDSYADRHGVAGSCAIIALSFTEFLENLASQVSERPYWLDASFRGHGDAYDWR
jgi:antitoxin YokJ